MTYYIIMCENGIQGSSSYATKEEAYSAARWYSNMTGKTWFVKKMIVRKL